MRALALVVVIVGGCVPAGLTQRAHADLHSSNKHTHLVDDEAFGSDHVYVFCRDEHSRDLGSLSPWTRGRTYDGKCITYVCPAGKSADACSAS